MAKKESSNPNGSGGGATLRPRPNWALAIVCVVAGLYIGAALCTYSPAQSTYFNTHPTDYNITGRLGVEISLVALESVGICAFLIPIFLLWLAYLALRNPRRLTTTRLVAMLVCLVAGSGLAALVSWLRAPTDYFPHDLGGVLGTWLYDHGMRRNLGDFGTFIILAPLYLCALLFVFTKDIGLEIENMVTNFSAWRENRARRAAELRDQRRQAALQAKAGAKAEAKAPEAPRAPLILEPVGPKEKNVFVPKPGTAAASSAPALKPAAKDEDEKDEPPPKALPVRDLKPVKDRKIELNIVAPEELKKARVSVPSNPDDRYKFPPLSILKEQIRPSARNSEEEHRQNAENLLRILGEFGVEVSLGEIHVGPVITRYEVVPAAGVRVEKISGLDKNIALGMRAQSVRILAPIPGKAAVGVEVPNQHPTPVGLREILESEDWASGKNELPIALGKDVSGRPLISDLTKMPHLLIAGATGSGKSVCINAIVASILYSKRPRDVRLIMIDPKVVELKIFNALPQMLIPVVTEPKKVPGALKWLLREMEQRYQIFAKVNVRNIGGFNQRKRSPEAIFPAVSQQPSLPGVDPLADDGIVVPDHMHYIVVIIDELADLMMVAPAEIETSVARLAQLARAAGIHLIIATQRPSVNVITGIIKANLPSRIAFQVASQVDSRTILDVKGADTLIGRGDMLFTPPGTSRLVRAQGAFVSDEEVHELVDFLKKNNDPPIYAQDVQAQIDRAAREDDEEGDEFGEEGEMGDDESLYRQAIEVLKASRRASTSMLQRRLKIGYNRAARIMELMEEKGIVGPENGSSPREILVDLDGL
ncbi:MAG TPA: DNA translocase FtsK [Opitutaceae bacterium]|jgi:S-DNA-T family DNA segregation ATPase FtsK/SpoIIIE|nr:DNA translocase FtsK [Opitutaceae bacterium]